MNIKESFTGSKGQRNVLIVIILLLICGLGYFQIKNSDMKRDLAISQQNTLALSDTVRAEQNKNKELEFSKGILVSKSKDLDKLSKSLSDELEKEKGKVSQLQIVVATMGNKNADGTHDTIEVKNTVYKYANGNYGLQWGDTTQYDSLNFRQIAGVSDFKLTRADSNGYDVVGLNTKITNDQIGFNIVTGLRDKDGVVEIFIRSDYPNFSVTQMEGAIIDPNKHPVMKKFTRQKKISVGPYVGYGLNLSNGTIGYGVNLGFGVQYNLFNF